MTGNPAFHPAVFFLALTEQKRSVTHSSPRIKVISDEDPGLDAMQRLLYLTARASGVEFFNLTLLSIIVSAPDQKYVGTTLQSWWKIVT